LTSVTIPAAEFGTRAVDLLMRRMEDGAAGEVRLIPPSLTVRGSTGPAAPTARLTPGQRREFLIEPVIGTVPVRVARKAMH
jgi:hypothetical protein